MLNTAHIFVKHIFNPFKIPVDPTTLTFHWYTWQRNILCALRPISYGKCSMSLATDWQKTYKTYYFPYTLTSQTNLCSSNLTIMHWVGACILYIPVEFTAPISHFPIPDSLNRTQESLIKAPSVRRTNYMQARKNFDVKWILWIQLKLKFYQSSQLMPLWSCDWYSASSNLQFGPNFRNSQPRSAKVHLN